MKISPPALQRPRWWAHLKAIVLGYFWLPCPLCGRSFAGFESRVDPTGHLNAIPTPPAKLGNSAAVFHETLICPECAAAARGCQAWRNSRLPEVLVSLACRCPKPAQVRLLRASRPGALTEVDYLDTDGLPVSHILIPSSLLDTRKPTTREGA